MSKSRRKAAGCTRGRYKRKNMGKGWALARRVPNPVKPLVRSDPLQPDGEAQSETGQSQKTS